jgi:translation initiation factor 5B
LFDAFTAYQQKLLEQRKKDYAADAIYPCALKTLQLINKRNPMIIGVDILEGSLRIGTPIAIVKTDPTTNQKVTYPLGRVVSLEVNHKSVDSIRKGQANAGVAMRLEAGSASLPTWGRQIDESDTLYSLISRKSIDILKDPAFRNDVPRDDWLLIQNLKPVFDIK